MPETEAGPTPRIDPRAYRAALGRFATGITIVTASEGGEVHGMTANSFTSVSLDPPLVLISVDLRAKMHRVLTETGRYGVTILSEGQEPYARHFAGRRQPDFTVEFDWVDGVPLIRGGLGHLACTVVDAHRAGDHTLFIGRVEYLDYAQGAPLLFFTGMYRSLEVQLHDWSFW